MGADFCGLVKALAKFDPRSHKFSLVDALVRILQSAYQLYPGRTISCDVLDQVADYVAGNQIAIAVVPAYRFRSDEAILS